MNTSSPPNGYIYGKSLFGSLQLVGTRKVGHKLSTNLDTVAPIDAEVSYQWTVGGKVVSTTDSYTIRKSDTGKKLTITITGKNGYIGSLSTSIIVK